MEVMLASLPNIQLTTVLFAVIFTKFDVKYQIYAILAYVMLQGIIYGFSLYLISMFIGWFIWLIIINLCNKDNIKTIALFSVIFAVLYGLVFYPLNYLLYELPFIPYLIADLPFMMLMAVSNVLTMLWVYPILVKIVEMRVGEDNN